MPSTLPDGEPVPDDGSLPESAFEAPPAAQLGLYIHVPFCRVRCGYCDFNTYTLRELSAGRTGPATGDGTDPSSYLEAALRETDLARGVLGERARPLDSIFVGGGTPTMLPADDLARLLQHAIDRFGLRPGAEVSTEANPDTVTPAGLATLHAAGLTRVSLGMQSAVPHVLHTLERTHDQRNVETVLAAADDLGLHTSVDLIYGTPGESLEDWRISLEAAIALSPSHISAYALVVEEGTKLAAQVRRGAVTLPEDDDEADKYELADELLSAAGYDWYEISNWARDPAARSTHNLGYWRGGDWWGIGPGAHSHVGGVRFWNAKHPRAYAGRLRDGLSPAVGREVLTAEQQLDERVLLGVRLAAGLPVVDVPAGGRSAIAGLVADGLVDGAAAVRDRRVRLTLRGRLLADTVVHALLS